MNRGYAAVGLVRPKYPGNVGGVMRAAYVHEAALVLIEQDRSANNKRVTDMMDTPNAWKQMPVMHVEDMMDVIPHGCVPIAVDLVPDARSLYDFVHPDRGLYIFGPEDGTLGRHTLDRCAHRIMIPTRLCMNLAATVNVVLYDRAMKRFRSDRVSGQQRVSLPVEQPKVGAGLGG